MPLAFRHPWAAYWVLKGFTRYSKVLSSNVNDPINLVMDFTLKGRLVGKTSEEHISAFKLIFWIFNATMSFPYFSLFLSLTFSFLNDTSIFSHFSNPGQSKNYVSCIPRIPFKLQFVEKWHFLTFALQFVWPFSFLERCGTKNCYVTVPSISIM